MYRAHWQFYKSIYPFIAAFSVICIVLGGLNWGAMLFLTLGPFIGMLGFSIFYREQVYFYYNLGITRAKLLGVSFLVNLLIGIPIFGVLILIVKFFDGDIRIALYHQSLW